MTTFADDHTGKTPEQSPTYQMTVRALPRPDDSRPAEIRLRSLAKLMLRGFGFRIVTLTQVPPNREAN